jgi:predicted Fe-Mo cluster-binding NifX family protein
METLAVATMERIAVPVFESRISPVLDACKRILLVDIDNGRVVDRQEISLENVPLVDRIDVLASRGVCKILCAGVSDLMCKYLVTRRITVISGIAGELDKIIRAYLCNRLDDACFVMPGRKRRKGSRKRAEPPSNP